MDNYKEENDTRSSQHHTSDVLLCGVASGAVAGFVTNGLEVLAVLKQTQQNFSVTAQLRQPHRLWAIYFRGAFHRTYYYGIQACMLFYCLETLKVKLNVEMMED